MKKEIQLNTKNITDRSEGNNKSVYQFDNDTVEQINFPMMIEIRSHLQEFDCWSLLYIIYQPNSEYDWRGIIFSDSSWVDDLDQAIELATEIINDYFKELSEKYYFDTLYIVSIKKPKIEENKLTNFFN